jgi:nitrogen-specific signal transduction histidine kinase
MKGGEAGGRMAATPLGVDGLAQYDGLPVAVLCFDGDDTIVNANNEAEGMFSQSLETMRRTDLVTLLPFTPAMPALLARCRRENARVTHAGIVLHGMSFEPVEADAVASPYPAAGDNAVVVVLFVHRRGRELAHVSELDAAMRSVGNGRRPFSRDQKPTRRHPRGCSAADARRARS